MSSYFVIRNEGEVEEGSVVPVIRFSDGDREFNRARDDRNIRCNSEVGFFGEGEYCNNYPFEYRLMDNVTYDLIVGTDRIEGCRLDQRPVNAVTIDLQAVSLIRNRSLQA